MSYKLDQDGNILIPFSVRHAEIVKMALITKTFQLRSQHAPASAINEIIPLMVMVDDAIVTGTKAALLKSEPTKPKPIEKAGFFTSLRNLFDPPFTIDDFEAAQTLNGEKHFIESMNFNGSGRLYPSSVEGFIYHNDHCLKAEWDSHGRCTCIGLTAEEVARFCLAVYSRSKTNTKKSLILNVLVGFLTLTFLSLIQ